MGGPAPYHGMNSEEPEDGLEGNHMSDHSPTGTNRTAQELGIEPVRGTCREHSHVIIRAVLAVTPGAEPLPQEICLTCTEQAGKLEGLRLWQKACSCCFSASFPDDLPPLDPGPEEKKGSTPQESARTFRLPGDAPAPGAARRIELGGIPVALFNVDGKLYAIGAVCPHEGGPLDEGEVDGTTVACPWHGSVFDLETGAALTPPAKAPVPAFRVTQTKEELKFEAVSP